MLRPILAALALLALVPLPVRAAAAPVLVVESFTAQAGVAPGLGAQFADAIAGEARDAGGVIVLRGAPAVGAAQFRNDARALNADDFLTGSIAAVGNASSVLIQLVSTRTGLLTWSTTVQVASAADLHGIGTQVRQVLLDAAGRTTFVPAPAAAATGGLFAAAGAPDAGGPPATYAVMTFGGSALAGDRTLAERTVLDAIRKRGASAVADAVTGDDVSSAGAQACMDTGAATIVGGTLDTAHADDPAPAFTASVLLQAYDCRTQSVLPKALTAEKSAPLSSEAIRTAASAVMASYFAATAPTPAPKPSPTPSPKPPATPKH